MEDRPGFNRSEYDAMLLRLEKLLKDPGVRVLKVKILYQERPNYWEGREYEILEEA